jgi:hypothetical protein
MSIRITLSDNEFPPSIDFVEFVEKWISGSSMDGTSWAEFGWERVSSPTLQCLDAEVLQRLDLLTEGGAGAGYVARAYELFVALLIGDAAALKGIHEKFRFILVVGIPRSGGKYLTKQLFRALGRDPMAVPAVLGHDGFPDARPWQFDEAGNSWMNTLQAIAEYLTMVEMYFGDARDQNGAIVVPKKATKAVYAAGLFHTALGPLTEGIITIRHPVPCCISTYEAAGGLPGDGRFAVRGNIEGFCARELAELGFGTEDVSGMDYFDAYLQYWESYHTRLAIDAAAISRNCQVLPYGGERYIRIAREFSERFGTAEYWIEPFHVRERDSLHSHWYGRSESAVERVAQQWERVGLEFPVADIAEAH